MKRSDELKLERTKQREQLRELALKNELSTVEKRTFTDLEESIDDLDIRISKEVVKEEAKARAAMSGGINISSHDENDLSKYSFARALRIASNIEKFDGIEAELHQEAIREARQNGTEVRNFGIPYMVLNRASSGQNVTTPADGGYLVQESPLAFIPALKNKMAITQLGARFLTGLVGDLPLINGNAFTAAFVAEGEALTKSKIAFSKATMKPKRLGAWGAISKVLLLQTNYEVERIIQDELVSAVAQALQTAAINGSGSGANPTGILNTVGIKSVEMGTDGAAIDWDSIVDIESAVNAANGAGISMGYLTNSAVIGSAKKIEKSSGTAKYLIEDGKLNGYSILDTNAVPSDLTKNSGSNLSALIFGAWENLWIGQWGGIDLLADQFSRKEYSEIEILVEMHGEVALTNPNRFGAIKDIVTA